MAERLMGIETEYAFTALTVDGESLSRGRFLDKMLELAKARFPHLPDINHGGIFLGNGSCLYVDQGLHPELSSPECTDPWDVVRYVKAGDRILAELAEELESTTPKLAQALLVKVNVDYSGAGSTWGCHESYLHRSNPKVLAEQIVPHLVSRVIYSGAGGFDPRSAGIEFTLSPRVSHIVHVVSNHSTRERGIFHTKNEPLCGHGYKRLHVLCGSSLCSETALWLMVGTTALVVAMIEAGKRPGDAVRLAAPLAALRAFARDPECKSRARLANGARATALAIQRHYLTQAEGHLSADFMPPWAGEVCLRWREVLDRLEQAPQELAKSLDWTIKLALYGGHLRRRQTDWKLLHFWTSVLSTLRRALAQQTEQSCAHATVTMEHVLSDSSPIREQVQAVTPLLRRKNLSWDDLGPFLALRQELFEIDTRFSQLGSKGIFSALDRAGVLEHRFPGVENIDHATTHPPTKGRARLRGEFIRKVGRDNGRRACNWEAVWDGEETRLLDLSDPFETTERWKSLEESADDMRVRPGYLLWLSRRRESRLEI